MRFLIVLTTVAVAVYGLPSDLSRWNEFKLKHNKVYSNEIEEQHRFQVFQENVKRIEAHNELFKKGDVTFQLGINQFTDLSKEELSKLVSKTHSSKLPRKVTKVSLNKVNEDDAPSEIDWRAKNGVSSVKTGSLKGCLDSYAFAAVANAESAILLKTGKEFDLSEQEILDCTLENGNHGCAGGDAGDVFAHIKENGLSLEQDYPFQGLNLTCGNTGNPKVRLQEEMCFLTFHDDLFDFLKERPITVGIDIDPEHLFGYAGGIYTPARDFKEYKHSLLAVGYTPDYYILKNSFGQNWGEGGYIRVARNTDYLTGIETQGCYLIY